MTNTGAYDADEIVQLYIHAHYSTLLRPVKELKGFKRVHIAKGSSVTVSFGHRCHQLAVLRRSSVILSLSSAPSTS